MNKWTSFKRHSLSIALRPTNFNEKSFISGILYQISLHKGISMNNYKTEFSNVPCNSTIWFNSYLGYNWYWNIIQESRWKANKIRMYLDCLIFVERVENLTKFRSSHITNIFIVIKTNCMNIIQILWYCNND